MHAKSLQLCPTLCNLIDCSPPGSWDSPGKKTRVGCHALLQGDLPDPEIEPAYLTSLTLPGELFTTSATWEALIGQFHPKSSWRWPAIPRSLFMVSRLSLVRSGSIHGWGPGNRFHPQVTSLSSLFKREMFRSIFLSKVPWMQSLYRLYHHLIPTRFKSCLQLITWTQDTNWNTYTQKLDKFQSFWGCRDS